MLVDSLSATIILIYNLSMQMIDWSDNCELILIFNLLE